MTDTTAGEGVRMFGPEVENVQSRYIIVHQLRASAEIQSAEVTERMGRKATTDRASLMREAADLIEALAAQPSAGAQTLGRNITLSPFDDQVGNAVISPEEPDGPYWTLIAQGGDAEQNAIGAEIVRRLNATPAQPDTGDVAALREAVARIIDPKAWEFYDRHKPNPIMGAEIANETRPSLVSADRILAALSKPNAPGAR